MTFLSSHLVYSLAGLAGTPLTMDSHISYGAGSLEGTILGKMGHSS